MKRKITLVTTGRADYHILKNLIRDLRKEKSTIFKLIVTGSHYLKRYGLTYKEILKDNIKINRSIKIPYMKNDDLGIQDFMGKTYNKFLNEFRKNKPDILILLGDRFEVFSVAVCANFLNIPIAHIHGGELSRGAIDNNLRHCITKLSHIHFVSTNEYKRRVIQLGECQKNVFNVGSLGVEAIKKTNFISKTSLEKQLKIKFRKQNLLITYHPVTLEKNQNKKHISEILSALKFFKSSSLIFTMPNIDSESGIIIKKIKKFVKKNTNSYLFHSLGQKNFFSCIKCFDGVIGNSSSGIIEVPSLNKGSVNIGDRQTGRIMSKSIINCKPNKIEIKKAIIKLLSNSFKSKLNSYKNPYYKKNTTKNIIKVLKKIKLNKIIKKNFKDIR